LVIFKTRRDPKPLSSCRKRGWSISKKQMHEADRNLLIANISNIEFVIVTQSQIHRDTVSKSLNQHIVGRQLDTAQYILKLCTGRTSVDAIPRDLIDRAVRGKHRLTGSSNKRRCRGTNDRCHDQPSHYPPTHSPNLTHFICDFLGGIRKVIGGHNSQATLGHDLLAKLDIGAL
jgi:hypothetical protein